MSVDSVYAAEGPYAMTPTMPAPGSPYEKDVERVLELLKGHGVKRCRCTSHHRPHLHFPCLVRVRNPLSAPLSLLGCARRRV